MNTPLARSKHTRTGNQRTYSGLCILDTEKQVCTSPTTACHHRPPTSASRAFEIQCEFGLLNLLAYIGPASGLCRRPARTTRNAPAFRLGRCLLRSRKQVRPARKSSTRDAMAGGRAASAPYKGRAPLHAHRVATAGDLPRRGVGSGGMKMHRSSHAVQHVAPQAKFVAGHHRNRAASEHVAAPVRQHWLPPATAHWQLLPRSSNSPCTLLSQPSLYRVQWRIL